MRFPRSSGILLHITSLPGPLGIGDLGKSAFEFVDFLQAAGQGIWQILPLGPPAQGNSPYSCYSAFAGSPLLISPAQLVRDGFLDEADVAGLRPAVGDAAVVDYPAAMAHKLPVLDRAFRRFRVGATADVRQAFESFCQQHAWWLDDFARYESLLVHFQDADWTRWPSDLVQRCEAALAVWDQQLSESIEQSKFLQFLFDLQWSRLKAYANERQIRMYGDMPIFVAHHSADVWAHQDLFCLDDRGHATLVAGVPPDYFSETGQLWGNPQYRWDVLEASDFAWWTARFAGALRQFDLLRVDHFRGFEAYWEIPADAETAIEGSWQPGPQDKPFRAAQQRLGELPIVVEDLGMITPQVHELRERLGFPGMRVFQFGFDDLDDDFHRPNSYPEHSVAYTGTHDNETVMGWYHNRQPPEDGPDPLDDYVDPSLPIHVQLIQAVLDSPADTAVIPMQDVLGLGNEARMNLPGKAEGNWTWRVDGKALSSELAAQLKQMTESARR